MLAMKTPHPERGASLIVLVIGLVIVGLAAWIVLSQLQESRDLPGSEELGAAAPIAQAGQQRTFADMRAIGRALSFMQVDTGAYPQELAELERGGYLELVPETDGWGNGWVYAVGPNGYTLTSLGADGRPGPGPPSPWITGAYDCDLLLTNGQITQGPTGR
jgi:hypothetical protein